MKSIEVIVPRVLVKKHYPHPEFYGESIVELANGMETDVYTDEEGRLFTITGEIDLIEYLKQNQADDEVIRFEKNGLCIRSIKWDDVNTLFKWFNQITNYSYNELGLSLESVEVFVSHSISMNSHLFMISQNSIDVGIVSYSIFDDLAIVGLEIYLKEKISSLMVDKALNCIIEYLSSKIGTNIIETIIFDTDSYTEEILTRNGFKFISNNYEFAVSFEDIKKGHLYRLNIKND